MDFDSNSWYRLTVAGEPQQSLAGTYPYMRGNTGPVTVTRTDTNTPSQQWHFLSIGSFGYILRTQASGVHGYLTIKNGSSSCEDSSPVISNQLDTNDLTLWIAIPQGDGTFQLSSTVHESQCVLDFDLAGETFMSSTSTRPRTSQIVVSTRLGKVDEPAFLALPSVTPGLQNSLSTISAISTTSTTSIHLPTSESMYISTQKSTLSSLSTSISNSFTKSAPSTIPSSLPPPRMHATNFNHAKLSPSAALGLGVAVGIIIVLLLFSFALFVYYRCTLHQSQRSQPCSKAKLWKGFTPATPSTTRGTLTENQMANNYFAELPTPATPAFMISPPLGEAFRTGMTWGMNNRNSWQKYGPVSPIVPGSPPIELPV